MDDRRYEEVLNEQARLTRNPLRAVLLLLIAIVLLSVTFGPRQSNVIDRYFFRENYYSTPVAPDV